MPFVDWRERVLSGRCQIEHAARSQQSVAQRFGIEPPPIEPPMQTILGVEGLAG